MIAHGAENEEIVGVALEPVGGLLSGHNRRLGLTVRSPIRSPNRRHPPARLNYAKKPVALSVTGELGHGRTHAPLER